MLNNPEITTQNECKILYQDHPSQRHFPKSTLTEHNTNYVFCRHNLENTWHGIEHPVSNANEFIFKS